MKYSVAHSARAESSVIENCVPRNNTREMFCLLSCLVAYRIGDVNDGNIDLALDGICEFVHGVGRNANRLADPAACR